MSATASVRPVPFLSAAVIQDHHRLAPTRGDTVPPRVREDCQGHDLQPSSNTHLLVPAISYTLGISVGVATNVVHKARHVLNVIHTPNAAHHVLSDNPPQRKLACQHTRLIVVFRLLKDPPVRLDSLITASKKSSKIPCGKKTVHIHTINGTGFLAIQSVHTVIVVKGTLTNWFGHARLRNSTLPCTFFPVCTCTAALELTSLSSALRRIRIPANACSRSYNFRTLAQYSMLATLTWPRPDRSRAPSPKSHGEPIEDRSHMDIVKIAQCCCKRRGLRSY